MKSDIHIRRFGSRQGQAAVLAALNLTVLFGALGFAVDMGLGEFKKHAEQATADAAAMAAATYAYANSKTCSSGITCNVVTNCTIPAGGVTTPFGAACVYAQANGYTNGGSGGQTVTMIANNTNSPVTGNTPSLWFKATVGESYSTLFGSFGGVSALTIHASAVAATTTTGGGSCIIALSQSGLAFSTSGSGNITTSSSCGIYDNGNFKDAGSGNISGGTTQYLGTYSKTGSGNITPAATQATSAVSDPFATVPSPPVGSCTYTNFAVTGSSNQTLSPGVYCGGLKITGSGNVTFDTGTYIINGTDAGGNSFDATGSGNLSGTNVMFFITAQGSYTAAGPVNISGSGNLSFSALNSGPYEGILFYQDRNVTYAGTNKVTGSGNVTGTWYFPTTALSFSGSGNASYEAIVAYTVTMTGSGNFEKDLTGSLTGLVKTVTALIQ